MKEQIDNMGAGQARHGLLNPRTNTGKLGERGKERKKDFRAHSICLFYVADKVPNLVYIPDKRKRTGFLGNPAFGDSNLSI